ncbi:hypothetical protein [Haloglomus halophilum]|uniref:hypothetical protein n=1 Tax=Haloglomus halophilum TaxID=2962672 RepID=UPI0020C9594A|nr:hypothetical protein [Haloglomus halophilum]
MGTIRVDDVPLDEMAQKALILLGREELLELDTSELNKKLKGANSNQVRHRIRRLKQAGCVETHKNPNSNNDPRDIQMTGKGQNVLNRVEVDEKEVKTEEDRISELEEEFSDLRDEFDALEGGVDDLSEAHARVSGRLRSEQEIIQKQEEIREQQKEIEEELAELREQVVGSNPSSRELELSDEEIRNLRGLLDVISESGGDGGGGLV